MSSSPTLALPTLHEAESTNERSGRAAPRRLPLVQLYLDEQQQLSAVEKFSRQHATASEPAQARYYKSLLPATAPGPGQQYAFRVDLDACTGCKACVTACHSLNGLDTQETWRSVGLLRGGTASEPVQQTVTTACHHCVDPACMNGCPVNAYEKDPHTGIVRHLDDQCIGCQYCTLTCPYEVPQYNKQLGIVRKCDMCSERLAQGEAPACVQACPNQAISIGVVEVEQALEDAQGNSFLPGAPSPGITVPTTEYKTRRAMPKNMLPADFYDVRPSSNHVPLVIMLVLTQLSVGAFGVDLVLHASHVAPVSGVGLRYHALVALVMGLLALVASTAHLGRPQYAFRAILGIRHSWISREALAFSAFAGLAVLYAASSWGPELVATLGLEVGAAQLRSISLGLGTAVAVTGMLGIWASVKLYAVTRRVWWSISSTGSKFFGSALVLGLSLTVLSSSLGTRLAGLPLAPDVSAVVSALLVVTLAKLLIEASIFGHLRDKQVNDLKRTALLMRGALAHLTRARYLFGGLCGVVLPSLLLSREPSFLSTTPGCVLAAGSFLGLLAGEFLERTLFFTAVCSPKMPGAPSR